MKRVTVYKIITKDVICKDSDYKTIMSKLENSVR